MKPWRLLRDEMNGRRETRAEGNGAVNINLDLAYRLKQGEEQGFLEAHEIETIKERIRGAVALMPQSTKEEIAETAKRVADEIIAGFGPYGKRVSAFLIKRAIQLRYRNPQTGQIEVPRRAAENTKPGVWRGELELLLEDYPSHLEVSPAVAQWLVTTWFDDKVQNGLDDKVQVWANTYEAEMERVKAALEGKA